MSMAKDGMLSKAAFDKCIRDMVPASQLGNEEKTSFSVLLSSIFFSFDRDNRCAMRHRNPVVFLCFMGAARFVAFEGDKRQNHRVIVVRSRRSGGRPSYWWTMSPPRHCACVCVAPEQQWCASQEIVRAERSGRGSVVNVLCVASG